MRPGVTVPSLRPLGRAVHVDRAERHDGAVACSAASAGGCLAPWESTNRTAAGAPVGNDVNGRHAPRLEISVKRTLTLKLEIDDDAYAAAIQRITTDEAVIGFLFTRTTKKINEQVGTQWAQTTAGEYARRR